MTIEQFSEKILNPEQPLRVHLIGVAGSRMSGLARLLIQMGHRVSGSDRVTSGETERLRKLGLDFSTPHSGEAVKGADAVIYSSAIRSTNPALSQALAQKIATFRRAECLAAILHTKAGVVVSGTHGKTTTSAMIAHILRQGDLMPCNY
ncbi:MAG: Mur ligase domain-containing protein, partial [Akkermansiaceae bacterium]